MVDQIENETKQVSQPTPLLIPPTGGGERAASKTATRTRKKLALEAYEHGKSVSLTQQRIIVVESY